MKLTTKTEIYKDLQSIIHDYMGIKEEQVQMASRFVEDLQCDSLDLVEMLIEIEDLYEIEVTDTEAEAVKTVEEAVDTIYNLINTNE